MSGFLGCAESTVIFAIVSSDFYMDTGINFFLRRLPGVMVMVIATAASTTTALPAGTTSPKGQDASAGCPRVVVGGCGTLENCVMVLHLVESCEEMWVSRDRQANRVVERVRDPILGVLDFHHFRYWVNSIVRVEAVEDVVLGHMGNRVLVKVPVLGVTVSVKSQGTQFAKGLLA
jgi:hypothetical protein